VPRTGDFLVYFWNILILDNSHDDDITVYEAPLQGGMRCGVTVLYRESDLRCKACGFDCPPQHCRVKTSGKFLTFVPRLQSVENAAARLVTGTRRTDHITPVLQSLRWLPVRQRVTFKLATLVHKCLNGRAPGYLADDFRLAGRGRPGSRSAASMMLDIPRTTTSLGDRAFAVAGPRIWNSLPPAICIRHCRCQSSESC